MARKESDYKDKAPSAKNEAVTDYWYHFYSEDLCTLCGNIGWIDTRGVRSAAGVEAGRVNWCICPNGQLIRHQTKLKVPPKGMIHGHLNTEINK